MEKQTLKFTIRQDGHVTEEATGFTSHQCVELTEKLEEKLGVVQWRKETQEYYQPLTTEENVTLQHNQNND